MEEGRPDRVGYHPRVATFTVGGQTLSYEIHGDGIPVVTLSNLAQPARVWPAPVVPKLTDEGYKVIEVQHLGPTTELDRIVGDVAALIEDQQLQPVHLWGYSQGGMFAQELALSRPDLIRSAVLMATVGRKTSFMRLMLDFVDHIYDIRDREPDAARTGMALMLLLSFPPEALARDALVDMIVGFIRDDGQTFGEGDAMERSTAVTSAYEDRLAALSGITVPCLVMAFRWDLSALASGCRQLADAIPGSRYVEIEGAAHAGIGTHTDEVVDHVLKFFADV